MRLIDADKLLEKEQVFFDEDGDYVDGVTEDDIINADIIDAVPVKGRWTLSDNGSEFCDNVYTCSNCHTSFTMTYQDEKDWNYCPHCGARMEEVEK